MKNTTACTYHPIRFYAICFLATWSFWILGAAVSRKGGAGLSQTLMLAGLLAPSITAVVTVFTSGSRALRADFKAKLTGFYRLRPGNILKSFALFLGIVLISILISLAFGQPANQLRFTDGFSFSVSGASALLTILLASVIEEVGWRGYGEDAIANSCSWFRESVIFGLVWALWHLPLFWIEGSYHAGLRALGLPYMLNFFVSVIALGFLTTWVYVRNHRSMLASILFHLFVNLMQEKIAMTPQTKCIETFVIIAAAAVVVLTNRTLFFETDHVGRMPEDPRLYASGAERDLSAPSLFSL